FLRGDDHGHPVRPTAGIPCEMGEEDDRSGRCRDRSGPTSAGTIRDDPTETPRGDPERPRGSPAPEGPRRYGPVRRILWWHDREGPGTEGPGDRMRGRGGEARRRGPRARRSGVAQSHRKLPCRVV